MNPNTDEDMKPEYDFSGAKRGQFYKPDLKLNLPVYLDAQVIAYLSAVAKKKGMPLSELANQLLKRDIEIIEAGK